MKQYRRISWVDRLHIERLYNSKRSIRAIAAALGFAPSAIHYELQHGFYEHLDGDTWRMEKRYSAQIAQRHADYQATVKGKPIKLGKRFDYCADVARQIRAGFSPDAIVGRYKREGKWTVSVTTLYRYIDKGYIPDITNKDLLVKSRKKKRKHHRVKKASRALAGESIERRPDEINKRQSFGHWEMDTVIGKAKGKGEVLLVLTERFTRYEYITHLPDKTAASVVAALNEIIQYFPYGTFRTITMDNGSEFSDCYGIETDRHGIKRLDAYYCHPYTSCERGSNENANKLIRRFFPKGTSLATCTSKDCQNAMAFINHMPRKILGYRCAAEVFLECMDRYL